jgi:hypothetical protein
MPVNFLRHYYDIYHLLQHDRVLAFIGTTEYFDHKDKRFRTEDEKDLTKNPAFIFSHDNTMDLYSKEFEKKSDLYFKKQPTFANIIASIQPYLATL